MRAQRLELLGSIPVGTGNPGYDVTYMPDSEVYPRGHGESVRPYQRHDNVGGLSPWARGIRN